MKGGGEAIGFSFNSDSFHWPMCWSRSQLCESWIWIGTECHIWMIGPTLWAVQIILIQVWDTCQKSGWGIKSIGPSIYGWRRRFLQNWYKRPSWRPNCLCFKKCRKHRKETYVVEWLMAKANYWTNKKKVDYLIVDPCKSRNQKPIGQHAKKHMVNWSLRLCWW